VSSSCDLPFTRRRPGVLGVCLAAGWRRGGCRCPRLRSSAGPAPYPERSWGLPQVLRLVRTRRVDGLSLTAWQAMLVVNLSWTAHGISIGQIPQIVTSVLSLCSTVPILYLMARELRAPLAACATTRGAGHGGSDCGRPDPRIRRIRGGGYHRGRRRQRRPEHHTQVQPQRASSGSPTCSHRPATSE
jgi:uncharacterized protein with PQ loop repeat